MAFTLVSSTPPQLVRVREDLDLPEGVPPDPALDDLFTRATLLYPDNLNAAEARVRIFLVLRLIAGSIKGVDYTANTSQLKRSQITDNLWKLLKVYRDDLQEATLEVTLPAVMWGKLHTKPAYLTEYPDDYFPGYLENVDGVLAWWQ